MSYGGCGLAGFWSELGGYLPSKADLQRAADELIAGLRSGAIRAGEVLDDAQTRAIIESMTPEQRAKLEREYLRQRAAELGPQLGQWAGPAILAGLLWLVWRW